jgi:polar amino acid transport system substrate-binding protein
MNQTCVFCFSKSSRHTVCIPGALKKTKSSLILIFLFLQLFSVSAVRADEIEKIKFGSINKKNARLYKISDAVLTYAFDQLGVKFELRTFPPNRIPVEISKGKIDGDAHRIYDYNYENRYPDLIRVEEPIQIVTQSVFTKRTDIQVNGWKSLSDCKILYLSGIIAVENGLESARIPLENRLGVYDIDDAFKLLNIGRGDIVIVSPSTGQASLNKLGLSGKNIKMLSPPVITIELYPYMHKKHADLAVKLAARIKQMKLTGRYDDIVNAIK